MTMDRQTIYRDASDWDNSICPAIVGAPQFGGGVALSYERILA